MTLFVVSVPLMTNDNIIYGHLSSPSALLLLILKFRFCLLLTWINTSFPFLCLALLVDYLKCPIMNAITFDTIVGFKYVNSIQVENAPGCTFDTM